MPTLAVNAVEYAAAHIITTVVVLGVVIDSAFDQHFLYPESFADVAIQGFPTVLARGADRRRSREICGLCPVKAHHRTASFVGFLV